MKTTISLNGVKIEKDIPTSWKQVTFRQAVELERRKALGNPKKIVSVFTGIEEEILSKAEIHNMDQVISLLSFTNKPIPQDLPETIIGYPVPQDLDSKCIAQAADVQEIMSKFTEETVVENLEQYPLIVATYIAPFWFGNKEYDFRQAEQIAPKFFDAPCGEVMAIGNFTWAKYVAWRSGTPTTSRPGGTRKNKWRRDMINWLVTLAFTIRFYLWKRSLPSPVRNFLNGR